MGPAPQDLPGLRPVRERAAHAHPAGHRRAAEALRRRRDLDWVIVRENSEGEYAGVGGRVHQGHPIEAATDVSIMTRAGVERIMRFAFRLAQSRPRKHLTVVTKSNAQRHAMVMWDEIAVAVSREFPDVAWDKELVDAATARMVNRPASLDTIVATNLHADILSDLAAALAGSLGIAPTAQPRPGAPLSQHVRAHPRLGIRYHRVAERDRAAVRVDLRRIEAEVLRHRHRLHRERLVRLDHVHVGGLEAGLLEHALHRRNRPEAHDLRLDARVRVRHQARHAA